MRLAVVYHDDDRVRATLDGRQADFKTALRQVAGRTEWGVKASALLDDRRASEPRHDGTSHRAVDRPGTEYLLQRRANLSARDQAIEVALASADDVHAVLGRLAVSAERHAIQDSQLSGDARWMVLNGAYLVDDDRAEEFVAAVSVLADRHSGIRLQLTGPWPPYSFAAREDSKA
jgi:hypothetical protein